LSAWAVWGDYQRGDWQMGTGDVLGAAGSGLETFALTPLAREQPLAVSA